MKVKQFFPLFIVGWLLFVASCKVDPVRMCDRNFITQPIPKLSRIAFGSCSDQNLDQSILYRVVEKQPQLFVYLGDNIYGDTYDMRVLEAEYGKLSCKPEFQNLISHMNVIATWDDHDYGHNDVGNDYPEKVESKQVFMNFWGEKNDMQRQSHTGVYTSYYYGDSSNLVQIILLDLRTFRSPLKTGSDGYYIPNYDSSVTMLGSEQWAWLQNELLKPARVRIIGSSSRFDTQYDGDECWENFPYEIQKMFQTIRDAHANGVVFISGDVHFGELCKRMEPNLYPLYDCTASPLARHANPAWGNAYQIAFAPEGYNFGMLDIDWTQSDPLLTFRIFDVNGNETVNHPFHLSEIYF
jgi:alkaline phosphatase D